MVVSFLALFPLCFGLFTFLFLSTHALIEKSNKAHICRTHLLQNQKKKASILEKLLKMNRRASALRKQHKSAQKKLAAATASMVGPAIAAAKAYLLFVKGQQAIFRAQQLFLLGQVRVIDLKDRVSWKQKMKFLKTGVATNNSIQTSGLAVYATPKFSLSPDYKTKPQFKILQKSTAELTLKLFTDIFRIIKAKYPESYSLKISCAATLKQKGKKWIPVLSVARP